MNHLDNVVTDGVKISEKFMRGDLLQMLMQEIKMMPVAWSMLPEKSQQEIIDRITARVDTAISKVVEIVAADGRAAMVGTLDKVQIKDGIQVQISMNKADPMRHELIDAQGLSVLLVIAGVDQFLGGEVPKATPNQVRLIDDEEDQ